MIILIEKGDEHLFSLSVPHDASTLNDPVDELAFIKPFSEHALSQAIGKDLLLLILRGFEEAFVLAESVESALKVKRVDQTVEGYPLVFIDLQELLQQVYELILGVGESVVLHEFINRDLGVAVEILQRGEGTEGETLQRDEADSEDLVPEELLALPVGHTLGEDLVPGAVVLEMGDAAQVGDHHSLAVVSPVVSLEQECAGLQLQVAHAVFAAQIDLFAEHAQQVLDSTRWETLHLHSSSADLLIQKHDGVTRIQSTLVDHHQVVTVIVLS